MKNALATLFRSLLICLTAWSMNTSAGELTYKIETFYDESAAMQIAQVADAKFVASTGSIRQPYQSGNLWLRITPEKIHTDSILYMENPAIDELTLYFKNEDDKQTWQTRKISLRQMLHGYSLQEINQQGLANDNGFYLNIKTTSPKQFNVLFLSAAETQKKEYTKYAVLSSQATAAVILMIWVSMQNWLARSKIFITVMISAPLFVLSRLNYFGIFLNDESSNSAMYLNLNMVLFLSLISGGTLMVKESFGRMFSKKQNNYFLLFFVCSLLPSLGLLFDIPRAHLVLSALLVNFAMVLTLFSYLRSIFKVQRNLIWHYKFQLMMFLIYSLMSTLPGFYFTAPQIFPFTLGIPTYRDYFYPVLAFLIMALMLNEQKEKEMDTIFNLAVTKANADLEIEKNKKQHVFLGMLLHEIKTPLSVIKFGAAALSNDAPKTQIWTQRVDSAADAINHILNQCLLADKFEFGLSGYSAEKVNIHAELAKLIERVSYLNPTYLERIQWQFSQELPHNTSSMVDPIFLRSILENLLTNALKYSATNSSVQLLVHKKTVANQAMLEFQIKNQIGKVGPPQVDKIFSRYYRAEEAQGYSGTGLGLWLANQQAKEMGTSIECTFDDMWTSFTFQISLLEEIS